MVFIVTHYWPPQLADGNGSACACGGWAKRGSGYGAAALKYSAASSLINSFFASRGPSRVCPPSKGRRTYINQSVAKKLTQITQSPSERLGAETCLTSFSWDGPGAVRKARCWILSDKFQLRLSRLVFNYFWQFGIWTLLQQKWISEDGNKIEL